MSDIYGNVHECCEMVHDLQRELDALKSELAEARADSIALQAWHSQFGTSQLSHAIAERDALKAENERMKIDAGKAYCVYCGTSGPKADIWKHVTVCDKHPLKTMADKMEEASGMIQVAMLIFDELGLSGNATAVTAVESIQKLKAEIERRDAFMVTAAETMRKTEAENERMREALERVATCLSDSGYPLQMENRLNEACRIISQALASRGRENEREG